MENSFLVITISKLLPKLTHNILTDWEKDSTQTLNLAKENGLSLIEIEDKSLIEALGNKLTGIIHFIFKDRLKNSSMSTTSEQQVLWM
jgi:hypothetical protein